MTVLSDQASRLRALVTEAVPGVAAAARTARAGVETARAETARVVAIASGKGGVGKTSLSVNISVALAAEGVNVALVDGDLGLGNADMLLGMPPGRHLGAVISGERSIEEVVASPLPRLRVIPGGSGTAGLADLGADARARLIEALGPIERSSDVMIVDCGAGLGPVVLEMASLADTVLVVTNPEPTAMADAYALVKTLAVREPRPCPGSIELVVNHCRDFSEASRVHGRIAAVADRFLGYRLRFAGAVRSDAAVGRAVRSRRPFMLSEPRGVAARDIRVLSDAMRARWGLARDSWRPRSALTQRLWRLVTGA